MGINKRKHEMPDLNSEEFVPRDICLSCFRVTRLCWCSRLKPFAIEPTFVLLVHPREFMKTIGTARIVKRSIRDAILWRGNGPQIDADPELLGLFNDPLRFCVILFPGEDSLNLSEIKSEELRVRIPPGKKLTVFILDGTWTTAKQLLRGSKILQTLPKVSFNVRTLSQYIFRKQPEDYCLSTVEAVCELIENLSNQGLCTRPEDDAHLQMLNCFQALVESQTRFELVKPN
jgi:DTW domain-containing protein YfiP